MTRRFFSLTTLCAVLLGVTLVSASNLVAQTAPPAPNEPTISITGTPEPPPPYTQSNPGPTTILFAITFADSTPGATIVYTITGPDGYSQSGKYSGSGTAYVSAPVNSTGGYVASAYAYIPANTSTCPVTPQSPNSATATASF